MTAMHQTTAHQPTADYDRVWNEVDLAQVEDFGNRSTTAAGGSMFEGEPPLAGASDEVRPQKPFYRFSGDLPTALAHLRDDARWVAWDYRWKDGRWSKPPFDPRTGRHASVSDPATWGTFDMAVRGMERHGLAGVGLVLTENSEISGYDLDHCITAAGSFSELAAEIVGYAETYAEISPSGEGIRGFVVGKVKKALKDDGLGVELYGSGRYLTITGRQLPDAPNCIAKAPRTLARLTALVEAAREAKRQKGNASGNARLYNGGFFRRVNDEALACLDNWVPTLHPTASKQPNGAWRITSRGLGRDLQEDLAYHPYGIRDHGEEIGLTPVDAVLRYGAAKDPLAAAFWLCKHMGVETTAMGWSAEGKGPSGTDTEDGPRSKGRNKHTQADRLIEIATGRSVELYHAPDGTTYADLVADGHRETWPLKSSGFRGWLARAYYMETHGAPNAEAISTAMGVIEARARFDGVERSVFLRVAEHGNKVYLDLCNKDWSAVEIDANGWRVVDRPLVRFRRTRSMLALPDPQRGGKPRRAAQAPARRR